jgi:hypothetical protein
MDEVARAQGPIGRLRTLWRTGSTRSGVSRSPKRLRT